MKKLIRSSEDKGNNCCSIITLKYAPPLFLDAMHGPEWTSLIPRPIPSFSMLHPETLKNWYIEYVGLGMRL